MSRWGKISWFLCAISIVVLVATRFILGGWVDYLFVPLGIFAVAFVAALVVDYKFYFEFLTMRTTKHGMNMGVLILLVLALLVAVNFLSIQHNKTWDFTKEKLNSLSDQTTGLLKGLKDDLALKVFYRGSKDEQQKNQIKQTLSMYQEVSSKLKVSYVDAYVKNALAQAYLKDLPDANQVVVFVEAQGRKIRVEQPFSEEKITAALIKVTRKESKKIYFLSGHGERDMDSEDEEGMKAFKQALIDSSFAVAKLNLLEKGKIPEDAYVVAIVGPQAQVLDGEVTQLMEFARKGGKLFIAADPGLRHNINNLLKPIGINYVGEFIVNDRIQLMGRGAAGALGLIFDPSHEVTNKFRGREAFTLFDVASPLKKADNAPSGLNYTEIVRTAPNSFAVKDLQNANQGGNRTAFALGIAVKGRLPGADGKPAADKKDKEKGEEFAAVVFGDSDFVAQKDIIQGLNRDLAVNAMAYLGKEGDLINIRPKKPEGTKLSMTRSTSAAVVIAGLALPLVMFILSGLVWFRRRGA